MKRFFLLIIITSLFLISCSKSDELSGGGTFKITASSGTTKTFNMAANGATLNGFAYHIHNPDSNSKNESYMLLYGTTNAGNNMIELQFTCANSIQLGKAYEYDYSVTGDSNNTFENGVNFYFEDWLDSDSNNTTKATVIFSRFQYPGRITGTAINYDKDGKILAKGEFDFVSTIGTN